MWRVTNGNYVVTLFGNASSWDEKLGYMTFTTLIICPVRHILSLQKSTDWNAVLVRIDMRLMGTNGANNHSARHGQIRTGGEIVPQPPQGRRRQHRPQKLAAKYRVMELEQH